MKPKPAHTTALIGDLSSLISHARGRVAQTVNSELVGLYWQVGHRLRTELLGEQRADYGKQVIKTVAAALTAEFGRGFEKRNLYRTMTFAERFPDPEIVTALRSQLSWSHLREIIELDDHPYILDFLGMPADYSESDLETAILREIEQFLLELGSGFSFVARQKRLPIGPDDFYLDLLFFHRSLRALVAIELKLGRFDARDKGQMELYLRWLDRHERQPGENPPLGLILCADKNQEQIELLELDDGTIRVASYLTELPPREILEKKLLESIRHARLREYGRSLITAAVPGPLETPAEDFEQ